MAWELWFPARDRRKGCRQEHRSKKSGNVVPDTAWLKEGRAGGLGLDGLLFPSCDLGIIVRTFQSHSGHLGHVIREYKRA